MNISGLTYSCRICDGVNHLAKIHCHYCGTIPDKYSWLGKEMVIRSEESMSVAVTVHRAFGAENQVMRRTIKRTARTVPMDYYATGE